VRSVGSKSFQAKIRVTGLTSFGRFLGLVQAVFLVLEPVL
jgi:hypothetical protein